MNTKIICLLWLFAQIVFTSENELIKRKQDLSRLKELYSSTVDSEGIDKMYRDNECDIHKTREALKKIDMDLTKQLREECASRGLSKYGNKKELQSRLKNNNKNKNKNKEKQGNIIRSFSDFNVVKNSSNWLQGTWFNSEGLEIHVKGTKCIFPTLSKEYEIIEEEQNFVMNDYRCAKDQSESPEIRRRHRVVLWTHDSKQDVKWTRERKDEEERIKVLKEAEKKRLKEEEMQRKLKRERLAKLEEERRAAEKEAEERRLKEEEAKRIQAKKENYKYHTCSSTTQESLKCMICLELLEIDTVLEWKSCRHKFHKKCAKTWMKMSNHCPLCRQHNGRKDIERKNTSENLEEIFWEIRQTIQRAHGIWLTEMEIRQVLQRSLFELQIMSRLSNQPQNENTHNAFYANRSNFEENIVHHCSVCNREIPDTLEMCKECRLVVEESRRPQQVQEYELHQHRNTHDDGNLCCKCNKNIKNERVGYFDCKDTCEECEKKDHENRSENQPQNENILNPLRTEILEDHCNLEENTVRHCAVCDLETPIMFGMCEKCKNEGEWTALTSSPIKFQHDKNAHNGKAQNCQTQKSCRYIRTPFLPAIENEEDESDEYSFLI